MARQRDAELANERFRGTCGKVLESLREHGDGLTRLVDAPQIPVDHNRSECTLSESAVVRENYYGSASEWISRRAAMLFSMLATLTVWKRNPQQWLTWYPEACAAAGGRAPSDISMFLPWNVTSQQLAC